MICGVLFLYKGMGQKRPIGMGQNRPIGIGQKRPIRMGQKRPIKYINNKYIKKKNINRKEIQLRPILSLLYLFNRKKVEYYDNIELGGIILVKIIIYYRDNTIIINDSTSSIPSRDDTIKIDNNKYKVVDRIFVPQEKLVQIITEEI